MRDDMIPAMPDQLPEDVRFIDAPELPPKWELKELKPTHRQVATLIAQGMKNIQVAALVGITPEYVSMLLRQPLMRNYIAELNLVTGARLEASFTKSVDVILDVMENGTEKGKLQAARLQLEATKRIGRIDPNVDRGDAAVDRLELLANRLLALQPNRGRVLNEDGSEITEAELYQPAS